MISHVIKIGFYFFLFVKIKKIHCPDETTAVQANMPSTAAELDLVNGGDDFAGSPDGDGEGNDE